MIMLDGAFDDARHTPAPAPTDKAAADSPEKVPEELLRSTQDTRHWQQCAAEYARILKDIDPVGRVAKAIETLGPKDDRDSKCREALQPARTLLGTMNTGSWPAYRTYMTYAALDTDALMTMCRYGLFNWQNALDAKALGGTAEDVQKIADGARDMGQSLNFSAALAWAAQPKLLGPDMYFKGNLATTEKLFDLGALANYNSQNLFLEVVEKGDFDVARAFARRAHTVNMDIERYVQWAKGNNRSALYENFRKLHWEYGRYTVADYETLVEKKQVTERSQMSIVFNFAARRVSEIFECGQQPLQVIKTDIAFEDYAEEAIRAAAKKLAELGGNPTPYDPALPGKRAIAKPKLGQPPQ